MKKHTTGRLFAVALAVAFATVSALLYFYSAPTAQAADAIQITSTSIVSEFPNGFRANIEAKGENEITNVALRFRVGQRAQGTYEYFRDLDGARLAASKEIKGEMFWRTGDASRYIPPGTIITYSYEVEDSKGNKLATDFAQFIYHDARFKWEELVKDGVTVAYHGPVKTRAEILLETTVETLKVMKPILGDETNEPIRMTMYNNAREMLEAYPPNSSTISSELITEGQAWGQEGLVLVLGGGDSARGTASHEVTHIIVHRVADSTTGNVPSWLNEGLAEFGNVEPGYSYDIALEFAIGTGRLMPVTLTTSLPGTPEDVIIYYGQSRSIVRMMIQKYGVDKMRNLMAALKLGKRMDVALTEVYEVDRVGLYNVWLKELGQPEYVAAEHTSALPTAVAQATVGLFDFGSLSGSGAAAPQTSQPTPSPTPIPSPVATFPPVPADSTPTPTAPGASGGGCMAGSGVTDLTMFGFLIGMIGLGARRRFAKK